MLETGASRKLFELLSGPVYVLIPFRGAQSFVAWKSYSPLITVALRAQFNTALEWLFIEARHNTQRTRCLERGNSTFEDACKQVGCAERLGQKLHGILQSESPWAKDALFGETVRFLACCVVSLAWGSLNNVCCIVLIYLIWLVYDTRLCTHMSTELQYQHNI